jgi:hypothetical protein
LHLLYDFGRPVKVSPLLSVFASPEVREERQVVLKRPDGTGVICGHSPPVVAQ